MTDAFHVSFTRISFRAFYQVVIDNNGDQTRDNRSRRYIRAGAACSASNLSRQIIAQCRRSRISRVALVCVPEREATLSPACHLFFLLPSPSCRSGFSSSQTLSFDSRPRSEQRGGGPRSINGENPSASFLSLVLSVPLYLSRSLTSFAFCPISPRTRANATHMHRHGAYTRARSKGAAFLYSPRSVPPSRRVCASVLVAFFLISLVCTEIEFPRRPRGHCGRRCWRYGKKEESRYEKKVGARWLRQNWLNWGRYRHTHTHTCFHPEALAVPRY